MKGLQSHRGHTLSPHVARAIAMGIFLPRAPRIHMPFGWPIEYLTSNPLPSGERALRLPGYFPHITPLPAWKCLDQYDDPSEAGANISMGPIRFPLGREA